MAPGALNLSRRAGKITHVGPRSRESTDVRAGTARAIQTGMERIRIEQHSSTGTLWALGWRFTIGYLHLTFWKGVLALLLWPYYLGLTFSALH